MPATPRNEYTPTRVSPPRDTLRELLEERRVTQSELARRMGKTLKAVGEILSDKADVAITPETALQLERALGLPAGFWLRREQAHRESLARAAERESLDASTGWLAELPMRELRRRAVVRSRHNDADAVRELLDFFQVATVASWRRMWSREEVTYRLSDVPGADLGALACWLRLGEIEAASLDLAPHSRATFEQVLRGARAMAALPGREIFPRLQEACASAGVALVVAPSFAQAPALGAARWIAGGTQPLIQLSGAITTEDVLWSTFLHEACHVLRHGKKPIHVDGRQPAGSRREQEASRFSRVAFMHPVDFARFLASEERMTVAAIQRLAASRAIPAGVIAGWLQADGLLDARAANALKRRVDLSTEEPAGQAA